MQTLFMWIPQKPSMSVLSSDKQQRGCNKPLSKTYKAMKRKVSIFVTAVAIFAVVYWLTCYVNVVLGAIALGLGINVIDKVFMEGAE